VAANASGNAAANGEMKWGIEGKQTEVFAALMGNDD
jgi:hypothetical protein